MFRKIANLLIRLYQKTISFDHGPLKVLFPKGFCRYYPSCSEYSRLSILKHGVFRGSLNGFKRILRCNPWSKGGLDEVK